MRKLLIIILLSIILLPVKAQQAYGELSAGISAGISSFFYKTDEGKYRSGGGGNIQLGYTFFPHRNWGIGTGAELALYQSKTIFDKFSDSYYFLTNSIPGGSVEKNEMIFRLSYTYLRETQHALFVNIPVFLQFQQHPTHGFYAKAGIKFGLPIYGKRISRYSGLRTSGYFPYDNIEYTDLPTHGFGKSTVGKNKSRINFRSSVLASVEAGWKWALEGKKNIYTGLYFDCGFKEIRKHQPENRLVIYNENGNLIPQSIWQSQWEPEGKDPEDITSRVIPVALGVTVRWSFRSK